VDGLFNPSAGKGIFVGRPILVAGAFFGGSFELSASLRIRRWIARRLSFYCTAMVTVFDVAPPMETPLEVPDRPKAITTGTAAPFDDPAGTSAST
jgi:hypothetical protein